MINSNGFTVGNTTWRALQAQVKKNQQDIAQHKQITQVLTNWGIKVVGRVDSSQQLPDPATYSGQYGNAYAVGAQQPFDYYIWTRADLNSNHPNPYWLNIGGLTVVGPQGAQGPQGQRGLKGQADRWWVSSLPPTNNIGEQYKIAFDTSSGYVYQRTATGWNRAINLIGPQGSQGLQGPRGPQGIQGVQGPKGQTGLPGNAVILIDIISSVELLPDPNTVDRNSAYIVDDGSIRNIWIITGDDTLMWKNAGIFGAGSLVVNNYDEPIHILNIDDYCQKPTPSAGDNISLVAYNSSGRQITLESSLGPRAGEIPLTTAHGTIRSGIPTDFNDTVILGYLNEKNYAKEPDNSPSSFAAGKRTKIPTYIGDASTQEWTPSYITVATGVATSSVPVRNNSGELVLPNDQYYNATSNIAISMKTADTYFSNKLYQHHKKFIGKYYDRDIQIHWQIVNENSQAQNFTTQTGVALTPSQFAYCVANGFYEYTVSSSQYQVLITGLHPTSTVMKLTGLQVVKSGSTTVTALKTFNNSIDLQWANLTGTITDTVTKL